MATTPIVEALDVLEEIRLGLVSGTPAAMVHAFLLERGEEAFGDCVVVAVALAAHAAAQARRLELELIVRRRILASAVRVMQQGGAWLPFLQGHSQRSQRQRAIDHAID